METKTIRCHVIVNQNTHFVCKQTVSCSVSCILSERCNPSVHTTTTTLTKTEEKKTIVVPPPLEIDFQRTITSPTNTSSNNDEEATYTELLNIPESILRTEEYNPSFQSCCDGNFKGEIFP